jgi:hypothetical protein
LLAFKAGVTRDGRWITARNLHSSNKVVICHMCDGSGVKMTQAAMPKVKWGREGCEVHGQHMGWRQGSVLGQCVKYGKLGDEWAINLHAHNI